ncbi:hypothetical protein DL93DRAFT_784803 [Clavulina sp. PMI_390]|nr:hypothetical protein DL93DRAFT_784803 [Clavulina sp. PMI_390]
METLAFPGALGAEVKNEMWINAAVAEGEARAFSRAKHGASGPTRDNFRLHLGLTAIPTDEWNEKCCAVFHDFWVGSQFSQSDEDHLASVLNPDFKEFRRHFHQRVQYINQSCRQHITKSDLEKEQIKTKNRLATARNKLFHSLVALFNGAGPLSRHPQSLEMLTALRCIGPKGMEETETNSMGVVIRVTPDWRSPEVNSFLQALEVIHDRYLQARGARQTRSGDSSHWDVLPRSSSRTAARDAPSGLHPAAYCPLWLRGIPEDGLRFLKLNDETFDFHLDDEVRCLAELA